MQTGRGKSRLVRQRVDNDQRTGQSMPSTIQPTIGESNLCLRCDVYNSLPRAQSQEHCHKSTNTNKSAHIWYSAKFKQTLVEFEPRLPSSISADMPVPPFFPTNFMYELPRGFFSYANSRVSSRRTRWKKIHNPTNQPHRLVTSMTSQIGPKHKLNEKSRLCR